MNTKAKLQENAEVVLLPDNQSAEALIAKAIDKNVSVETMERLLAMRRELKAELAKVEFDKAMAAFQADCPVIEKSSKVAFGTTKYSYASLDEIIKQVKGLLARNGFSYTFDTKKTDKSVIIYCKVKHKGGHMEVSEFESAIDTGAKMNITQKDGSANSYGKRYAFCNAFGILTGEEDADANAPLEQNHDQAVNHGNGRSKGLRATGRQIRLISSLLSQKGYEDRDLYMKYKVTSKRQLSVAQASQIIENLQKLPDRRQEEDEIDIDEVVEGIEQQRRASY